MVVCDDDEDSCEVVVEALIREHLTKKQLVSTLQAYKQEQPRLLRTINKRSVLQTLLGVNLGDAVAGRPSCSTLELFVQQQLWAQQSSCVQQPGHGTKPGQLAPLSAQQRAGLPLVGLGPAQQQQHMQQLSDHSFPAVKQHAFAAAAPVEACLSSAAAGSAHQQQQQQLAGAPCFLQPVVEPGVGNTTGVHAGSRIPKGCLQGALQDLVLDDVVDASSSEEPGDAAPAAAACTQPHPQPAAAAAAAAAAPSRLRPLGGYGSSGSAWGGGIAAGASALGVPALEPLPPDQQRQLLQLLWGCAADGSGGSAAAGGGCGVHPDAAWQQGFLWCDRPGLEWGLVQTAGGPCGVLAAVQGHLIATLMERGLWQPCAPNRPAGTAATRVPPAGQEQQASQRATVAGEPAGPNSTAASSAQLQEALADGLALMLWQCCCSGGGGSGGCVQQRPAKVAVLQAPPHSAGMRGLCDAAQVLRLVQVGTAHSLQQLQALMRVVLPQWCQPRGWGVTLLAYSALLSRGCASVAADMDSPDTQLVDPLGYCSMELVNLLLTGAAASNVFDGTRRFGEDGGEDAGGEGGGGVPAAGAAAPAATPGGGGGGGEALVLRGIARRARVGLLTLFEWYRYVEVGARLKAPQLPVWVVCSESHFTLVCRHAQPCQQQEQEQEPSAGQPLLLQFYDGLARQEGPVVLELRPARPGEGWSSLLQGVSEERGVWRGRPIPPLECVLETKWPDVAATWHGSEPIL